MTGRGARARVGRGPRGAAYDLLHTVAADDAYANLAWPGIVSRHGLDERDAALATDLAYGTLRWRGLYDAILATVVDRELSDLDPRVLDVLRLGVHQIVSMRIPDHAAVSETVALARSVAGDAPAGLVNAVLRRVAEGGDRTDWAERLAPGTSRRDLAIAWSHPEWIVGALGQALTLHPPAGAAAEPERGDVSGLVGLLGADNAPARPTLVARPGRMDPAELLALPGVEPGRWSPLAGILDRGRPEDLACVREGRAGVQDEGSQLIALAAATVPVEGPDALWVDLAAGPGGKAAVLAGLAAERGARVIAVEPHRHRADLVRRALGGMPGDHEVRVDDGRSAVAPGSADRVLVDVPCTGLGALRRRPEARWRRTPGDLASLTPLQRDLLGAALDTVRPGGVVAYATCSPHIAETDLVVEDVAGRRADVEILDARAGLPGVPDLGDGPGARLWPHVHGTDGMYLALMRRTGG